MQLLAEIVVDTDHTEIRPDRCQDVADKALNVDMIAEVREVVRQRLEVRPNLLNGGVEPQPTRVAGTALAGGQGHKVRWVEVVRHAADGDDSLAQGGGRNGALKCGGQRVAKPFVISEEIRFPSKHVGQDWAAPGSAKAILVGGGFGLSIEVVIPGVRPEVTAEVVFVDGAMPLVGAALSDELDLGAVGAVEVRGLVSRRNPEFLNTFGWGGHDARRNAAGNIGSGAAVCGRIDAHRTVHVIRVVAAIQLIHVLIVVGTRRISIRADAGLRDEQVRDVVADVR